MRILSVVNQKGGCGKTTTAINLAACLGSKGKVTLLVDLDPQAHSSVGFNVEVEKLEKSTYHVMKNPEAVSLEDIMFPVDENLYLAPSQTIMAAIEQEFAGMEGRESRLCRAVDAITKPFDFLIIDCPPQIGLLTFNALIACREALIPVEASVFSLHGIAKLLETIRLVEVNYDHSISIRALATIYDGRTKLAREVVEEMKEHFGKSLLATVIRSNVRLREAAGYGKPITAYDKKSHGFCDYLALAEEIVSLREDAADVRSARSDRTLTHLTLQEIPTLFRIIAPQAKEVRLVGDFNQWMLDTGKAMERNEQGVWRAVVPLTQGEHQYRFVVDGKWMEDPTNPHKVANTFGEENSLISVN